MTGALLFAIGLAVLALAIALRDLRAPEKYEFARARATILLMSAAGLGVYVVIEIAKILNN